MIDYCEETRLRIRVAVYAWAYEMHNDPLVSDAVFDHTARRINLQRSTSRPDLDEWFGNNFNPSTGMWVHQHPDKAGLERIYQMLRGGTDWLQIWLVAP